MGHSLTVHINQAPRDVSQLRKSRNHQRQVSSGVVRERTGTYKLKPIYIWIFRNELVDVPVSHPL